MPLHKCRHGSFFDEFGEPEIDRLFTDVIEHELGHLKHCDLLAPVKDLLQLVIRINLGFVRGILEVVTADVIPEFAGDFGPRDGFVADDRGELFVRLHRLHERCAWLPFTFGLSFSHIKAYTRCRQWRWGG